MTVTIEKKHAMAKFLVMLSNKCISNTINFRGNPIKIKKVRKTSANNNEKIVHTMLEDSV